MRAGVCECANARVVLSEAEDSYRRWSEAGRLVVQRDYDWWSCGWSVCGEVYLLSTHRGAVIDV